LATAAGATHQRGTQFTLACSEVYFFIFYLCDLEEDGNTADNDGNSIFVKSVETIQSQLR
jgi:hypothetical protein